MEHRLSVSRSSKDGEPSEIAVDGVAPAASSHGHSDVVGEVGPNRDHEPAGQAAEPKKRDEKQWQQPKQWQQCDSGECEPYRSRTIIRL